ncbi:MAG: DNA repair protein RecN [Treponemataceae bacterium]|nr:DNA repair protein RecN [Treponemataceae bacterium]
MLEDLSVKDFALIDTLTLELDRGFTVLSGETGAGKSIMIGALTFLLGGKGGTEVIRAGCKESRVSGTFVLESSAVEARNWLEDHGITIENDRVLLRRVIRDSGKTSAWIEDTPVTRAELAEFTGFLVDIHGQHEHQSLMYPQQHRKFLDAYAGIVPEVSAFSKLYAELVEKRRQLEELDSNDADRERRIDMLNFAVEEIDSLKLKPKEDETLALEESRLGQYEKLFSVVEETAGLLGEPGEGAVALLKKSSSSLQHASALDSSLEKLSERLESAFYEVSDILEEVRSYKNGLVFDPQRLAEVQERSDIIFKLKKKYASSVNAPLQEVIDYAETARQQLSLLENSGETREQLASEVAALEREVFAKAKALSEKRNAAAKNMSDLVVEILAKLGMKNSVFKVSVEMKAGDTVAQKCGPYGFDDIEFLISANPGSPVKPLAKIASGGELSRVMLALKTVLADGDETGTLVFDEIDTGIGGEIGVAIGEHISSLAQKRQILCITHLASIAVYADTQMKIEKSVENGSTSTHVRMIDGDDRVSEIARMLSGDAVSSASLDHARELLRAHGHC